MAMMKPEVRHSIVCSAVDVDPWIAEEDDLNDPPANETVWYDSDKNKRSPQLPPAIMMSSCDVKKVRRKSWHAIRFERKRKKGVVEVANVATVSDQLIVPAGREENGHEDNNNSSPEDVDLGPLPPPRQKRTSWWNIFANQPRSRRASQDVSAVARSTENFPIWTRSKSRSVDHGISAPFDIVALRSKVDGHVEKHLDRDIDGSTNSLSERKKAGPPENATTYVVADRDTLTSVAARFDTTPSELTKINRLATPFIFPGQQLYVPLRAPAEEGSDSSTPVEDTQHDDLPDEEKELLDNLRPVSPKPGHAERVRTPSGGTYPPVLSSSLDSNDSLSTTPSARPTQQVPGVAVPTRTSSIYKQFLKINVRHITDGQGVVGGVLLVTHNAVMFDPNVSDALVIEHGPEAYGVIAPMEFVVNAAIYNDIAHMRVGHVDHSKLLHADSDGDKPEIYYPRAEREPEQTSQAETETETPTETTDGQGDAQTDSLLVKDETFPELGTSIICGNDDTESVCSCTEREGDAFPKAFDRDLVTPTNIEDLEGCGYSGGVTPQLQTPRTADERRKSLLDHHWAIPSRDRSSVDADELLPTSANVGSSPGPASNTSADDQQDDDLLINTSTKPSCHDSGIDIRDTGLPPVVPLQTKKVYSDADIVLSREWVPPITIPPTQVVATAAAQPDSALSSSILNNINSGGSPARKKTSSVSFTLDNSVEEILEEEAEDERRGGDGGGGKGGAHCGGETKKNKMLKRLSYPMSWIETFSGDSKDGDDKIPQPHSADAAGQHPQSSSMFSKVFSRRSSVGTFIRQPTEGSKNNKQTAPPQPKLDYKSMVSVEDMPELFVSFDKLIPRPARSCEDPPLYLRLRMGKPVNRPIPHSTPLMSYGKKKMRPEYWFSIPKNRVDELYNFINSWVPHLYGELNEEHVTMRGYCLVEADTELWSDEPPPSASRHGSQDGDITDMSRESWEVLPMSDDLRRALYSTGAPGASLDIDLTPPDLIGTTEVLTYAHRESLCRHLPARAEGYMWTLAFSTSRDGFSLNSMYRKMHRLESPVLMVIMDTDNNVFGALTSCALQVSDHFYGTGESLLYRFTPQFQVFNWTGDNLYFVKGNNESLSIGAGDGKFGLWLDGDLYQGRTETCQTYANEPLTPNVDFVVKTLECWVFV